MVVSVVEPGSGAPAEVSGVSAVAGVVVSVVDPGSVSASCRAKRGAVVSE